MDSRAVLSNRKYCIGSNETEFIQRIRTRSFEMQKQYPAIWLSGRDCGHVDCSVIETQSGISLDVVALAGGRASSDRFATV